MVALRGMTILPGMVVHFDVSRKISIAAVQKAMTEEQKVFLVGQRSAEVEIPGKDDVYEVGTIGTIKQIIKLPKYIIRVLAAGEQRAALREVEESGSYLRAEVELIEEDETDFPADLNSEAMERGLKDMLVSYAAGSKRTEKTGQ